MTKCVSSVEEMRVGISYRVLPDHQYPGGAGQRGSSVAPEVGVELKEPAWPLTCTRWTCPPAAHIYWLITGSRGTIDVTESTKTG